jgi:hypothetical protein
MHIAFGFSVASHKLFSVCLMIINSVNIKILLKIIDFAFFEDNRRDPADKLGLRGKVEKDVESYMLFSTINFELDDADELFFC